MSPPPPDHDDPRPHDGPNGNGSNADEFGELRSLLVGPEEEEIRELKARLDDPRRFAEEVGNVLAPALRVSARDGQDLAKELRPPVEQAVHGFLRDDPTSVAEVIFPVIGPAIRKSIAAALRGLVQSVNRSLEHSLTLKGLKWRLEARRTGRSFAEVVLLHSLVYRVEQVFLIHRETGLMLEHVVAEAVDAPDGDMISGMLTAIQDFAHDSFHAPDSQGLDSLELGELTVWLEHGPHAVIAAVVRGQPPVELREELTAAAEDIQRDLGYALDHFDGDNAPFGAARPRLEECLAAQYEEEDPSLALPKWFWLVLFLSVAGLLTWGWLTLQAHWRWREYLTELDRRPGIVVTEADRTSLRGGTVAGLRDPLAERPADVAEAAGLDLERMVESWKPYQSLDPEIVAERSRRILQPPPTVDLRLRDGALVASGSAQRSWLESSRVLGRAIPGVSTLDLSGVDDETAAAYRAARERVEKTRFYFDAESEEPLGDLNALGRALADLGGAAAAMSQKVGVRIVGRSDATGNPDDNLELSKARAERVRDALRRAGVEIPLSVEGRGSQDPVAEPIEGGNPANRSVGFEVIGGGRP